MNLPSPSAVAKAAVMTAVALMVITAVKNVLPANLKATANRLMFGA